jgi:hypothetical protein
MTKVTEEWWCSWCGIEQVGGELPNEEDMKQLRDALDKVTEEASSRINIAGTPPE